MKYQILYVNQDAMDCAKELTDEHVKIMCLRLAQALSYSYRQEARHTQEILDALYIVDMLDKSDNIFRSWLFKTTPNHFWAYNHLVALLAEHEYRFGKPHPSAPIAKALSGWTPKVNKYQISNEFYAPPFLEDTKYEVDHNKKPRSSPLKPFRISEINSYRKWYDEKFCVPENFTKRPVPSWSYWHKQQAELAPQVPRTRRQRIVDLESSSRQEVIREVPAWSWSTTRNG